MIEEFKFGLFKINGKQYVDDIKIIENKVKYWQDRDKHTLNIDNIKDILDANPELLIVGIGASGLLEVPDQLRTAIAVKRIKLIVDKTPKACEAYNKAILQKKRVAAIFHATC